MKTSKQGLMALVSHEGIVTGPYKDSVGVWTIGIGHTAAAGWPNPKTYAGDLSVADAFALFRGDVADYEADVNAAVKIPLKQHEFDALVSFHYNTGAIRKASLTKSLNAGNHALAAQQFMNWLKPPEVRDRRAAERDLFRTGKYPTPFANVYQARNGKVLCGSALRVDLRAKIEGMPSPVPADAPRSSPAPEPAAKVPKATPEQPTVAPSIVKDMPAAPAENATVMTVDGPKKDETTIIIAKTPQAPPASPGLPTSKTGFAALAALGLTLVAGVVRYVFGG